MIHNAETSPWIRIDLKRWGEMIQNRTPILYKKNSAVFHQDEPHGAFYIVNSGRIRVTTYQRSGAEKQIYIAEQGALFGEASCMMQRPHSASAVAIVDSLIYAVPAEDAEAVMRANWDVNQLVLQSLCRKKSVLFKQVVELSFADALQRIAQVLINLGQEYGKSVPTGVRISIRFTHQDVANLTNTSRVTVSNMFNFLASRKIVSKEDGHFTLHRLETLHKMADGRYSEEE